MPITPAALRLVRKACSFDYQGSSVHLEYYPAALGPATVRELNAWIEQANAATDDESTMRVLLAFGAWVCTLLASWDYLEDDGATMQPITPENIATQVQTFPDFIVQCVLAIVQDRQQGNASGTPSSASSPSISSPTASSDSLTVSQPQSVSSSPPAGSTARPRSNG
jgi:hypothetical protein